MWRTCLLAMAIFWLLPAYWLPLAYAATTVVTCEPPKGLRLDYGGSGLSGEGVAQLTTGQGVPAGTEKT